MGEEPKENLPYVKDFLTMIHNFLLVQFLHMIQFAISTSRKDMFVLINVYLSYHFVMNMSWRKHKEQ